MIFKINIIIYLHGIYIYLLKIKKNRRQQGSNLRGRSPTDFKSVSLTTRTYRPICNSVSFLIIYISINNILTILLLHSP